MKRGRSDDVMTAKYQSRYLENLSKGVEGMWLKQRYTDVTIRVDGKAYNCHKVLLGSLSGHFKELFMQEKGASVEISNTDSTTFEAVLQYIYTGRNDLVRDNIQAVLKAAVNLQIPCLQEQCEDFLKNRLTPETCIGIWKLGSSLGCSSLTTQSWSYVLEFFPSVLKEREFAGISIDDLISIINDDDLNTASEEAVCTAVMNWVGADPAGRKQYIEKLFGYVRFPLMTAEYIEALKQSSLIKESKVGQDILKDVGAFLSTGTVNPRQFHHRKEEMFCVVGTRSRHPKPELTEIKCYSFNRDCEYVLASLPEEPGACYAVCAGDNNVYLSGGYMGQRNLMKFISAENCWKACSPMQEGRWGHSMESVGGAVYIIGGSKKIPETIDSIEVYNPALDSCSVAGNLVIPVFFTATAALGDKIYVFGGKLENRELSDKIQCFDTQTRQCTVVGTMPKVSAGSSRTVVTNNTVYIFYSQGEVVEYREGGQASMVANIPQFDHFGAVAHNGQIIIDGSLSNQASTLVFDPATKEVFKHSRTIKSALCNLFCMTIIMSKQVLLASSS